MVWEISDEEIQSAEKLLLPEGAHFDEYAKSVIRCWESRDVLACPGSGKTTVLLAKLKILADRMPLNNRSGVCVLSHTNVAVDEIKSRLFKYSNKLMKSPNYIGTIQSFIDNFITIPYLNSKYGCNPKPVDDLTYARHMENRMKSYSEYSTLNNLVKANANRSNKFNKGIDFIKNLYLDHNDNLCMVGSNRILSKNDKESAKQYKNLEMDLLEKDEIFKYRQAYTYAKEAINHMSEGYKELFSLRFKYIFVDEYQDCTFAQREILDAIFNVNKCNIIKIGDADQAIYNSSSEKTEDWVPQKDFLPILTSYRYSQEIADFISFLKKDQEKIVSSSGITNIKPGLIVFEENRTDVVIPEFSKLLDKNNINDTEGIYKAIGFIKDSKTSGLKIGSYWSGFDDLTIKKSDYNYCSLIDEISVIILEGKLYKLENTVRKIIYRLFHYGQVEIEELGRKFTPISLKKFLFNNYNEKYRDLIYNLSRLEHIDEDSIKKLIRDFICKLIIDMGLSKEDILKKIPRYFFDKENKTKKNNDYRNIYTDEKGRKISFDTIHGVKGETHDATLYLETDIKNGSDLSRVIQYFKNENKNERAIHDYSRKLAYVGMSRPRKFLCIAMKATTYEKWERIIDNKFQVIDTRSNN